MKNFTLPDDGIKIPAFRWEFKWFSLFGIAFFPWLAVVSQMNDAPIAYFLFFLAGSLMEAFGFLLSYSTLYVNDKSIITIILNRTYKIDWNEVKMIECDGGNFIFWGEDKCFPIQLGVAGKGKNEFKAFLEKLIDQRQIEVKLPASLVRMHKNTRIDLEV